MSTKIEWCDETINPIVGCTKISEGCQNCYAEKMAWRLKCMGHPQYQDVVDENGWTGKIGFDLDKIERLPMPRKGKRFFVVSMGDIFNKDVSDNQRDQVFYCLRFRPRHTNIILTKRPGHMKRYFEGCRERGVPVLFWESHGLKLWKGVTVENNEMGFFRLAILKKIPAAIKFVSVEPMLERVDFENHLSWLDWVIVGPETGPWARECKPEWIESLYEQCKAAGVPFFDKRKDYLVREFPK